MHSSLDICLAAILAIAATTDLLSGRIPNVLTYPAIVLGLGAASLGFGPPPASAMAGFLVGGGVLYVMFAIGWIGGGDVKLMAAVGAFTGLSVTLSALFYAVFLGGVYAALVLLWRAELWTVAADVKRIARRRGHPVAAAACIVPRGGTFPFGVAIALGTALALARASGL